MTNKQQVINYDNDYTRKVQAGILIPKRQHENFEHLKAEVKEIKTLLFQVLEQRNK